MLQSIFLTGIYQYWSVMRLMIKFKLLFCLVMVLNICCKVKCDTKIDIYREERDTFTNIAGCTTAKADCFAVKVCTYCRCAAHHTFLQTRGERGECVPNELLVPATCKYIYRLFCWTNDSLSNGKRLKISIVQQFEK
jgi:hypothetical protein